ncbi:MAG: UDP-N-acetylmuramate dehydrogenase [Planctomycetota bacterium]|jgi:UDP-N-acetylmuramate dehydrogenase
MSSSTTWPCAALQKASLSNRTTLRIGGEVEWLLEPTNPEEMRLAWIAAHEAGGPVRLLGGGANLLIEDGVLPGVVIATARMRRIFRLGDRWEGDPFMSGENDGQTVDPDQATGLVVWGGATLPGIVRTAYELGWTGLEGLVGVPGHLGGGIAMNAGGRWGELWDVVETVRVIGAGGEVFDLDKKDCSPTYRNGNLGDVIVSGAVLHLEKDSKPAIHERMSTYLSEKRAAQPVTESSSGCIFKNPDPELSEGRSAGQLVEQAGAKGLSIGGAVVSELHGNFILNRGEARASEVIELIGEVTARVADKTGVVLEREVQIWRSDSV